MYLETTVEHQNCTHGEIKSRLNSGNDCYHSVHNQIHRTIASSVVLRGSETRSHTLREEGKLRLFA